MKKAKVYTLTKVFTKEEKKSPPSYVKIDGHVYERLETKTVSVDVDLDPDVVQSIEKVFKQGGFVNRQEVMREAIRKAIGNLPADSVK